MSQNSHNCTFQNRNSVPVCFKVKCLLSFPWQKLFCLTLLNLVNVWLCMIKQNIFLYNVITKRIHMNSKVVIYSSSVFCVFLWYFMLGCKCYCSSQPSVCTVPYVPYRSTLNLGPMQSHCYFRIAKIIPKCMILNCAKKPKISKMSNKPKMFFLSWKDSEFFFFFWTKMNYWTN